MGLLTPEASGYLQASATFCLQRRCRVEWQCLIFYPVSFLMRRILELATPFSIIVPVPASIPVSVPASVPVPVSVLYSLSCLRPRSCSRSPLPVPWTWFIPLTQHAFTGTGPCERGFWVTCHFLSAEMVPREE